MTERIKNSEKLYSVEFVRFIFAAVIVYYHILHSNIKGAAIDLPIYERLYDNCAFAGAAVECFFIISGYFLYKSFQRRPNISVLEFAYNKFARLWPVHAVFLLIGLLFFYFNGYDSFYNIFFLQAVGVTPDVSGITWYVSPLFTVMIFMFAFYKNTEDKKKYNMFLAVFVYLSYVMVINDCSKVFRRHTIYGVFSIAVLRAVAGIGLGYLIAVVSEKIKNLDYIKNFKGNWFQNTLIFILVSAAEIASFYFMMRHFLDSQNSMQQQFFVVLLFTVFFVCLLSRRGVFTLLFNNKFFGILGKYAYSIYMMQQIAFYILQKVFWENSDYTVYLENHFLRTLIISTVLTILFGIITYYAVEKPFGILLSRFGKKLFAKKKIN